MVCVQKKSGQLRQTYAVFDNQRKLQWNALSFDYVGKFPSEMITYTVIFGYRDHGYDKFMPMNNFLVLYCPNQVNQPLYYINIHGYNE